MRIAIIGGVERNETQLTSLAAAAGHELFLHSGHLHGGGAGRLEILCERCDLVVIVTDVNSHNAVLRARRVLRDRGRTPVMVRKFGRSRLLRILAAAQPTPAPPPIHAMHQA